MQTTLLLLFYQKLVLGTLPRRSQMQAKQDSRQQAAALRVIPFCLRTFHASAGGSARAPCQRESARHVSAKRRAPPVVRAPTRLSMMNQCARSLQ